MADAYDTLNDAVYQAAVKTRAIYGNQHEAISVVYEGKDGKFYFTEPTTGEKSNSRVNAKLEIPKGSARFIVHNHPDGKDNDAFSDDDLANAERLKVPSAIIFGKDPTIRIYTPGVTKTDSIPVRGSRNRQRMSKGDEFKGMMQ